MRAFRSESGRHRAVALLALLVVVGIILIVASKLSGFPHGYNSAQDESARTLAGAPDHIAVLVRGTTRDLLVFIPIYVLVVGMGCVVATSRPRPAHIRRLRLSDRLTAALMLVAGLADVIETLLFRRTLEHLQSGTAWPDLNTATTVTRCFTALKIGFIGLFAVAVFVRALARPAPPPPSPGPAPAATRG